MSKLYGRKIVLWRKLMKLNEVRRGKFIYNRTYNPVRLNKVNHFSRRVRAPSRLPLKSLLKKTQIGRVFVWRGILKNTPLSSKIHCYLKNKNGLYLNRYRTEVTVKM